MEVVLLWLDEFDDLVSLSATLLGRIRRVCLAAGTLAALPVPLLVGRADLTAAGLAVFAAACVLGWLAACVADGGAPRARMRATAA